MQCAARLGKSSATSRRATRLLVAFAFFLFLEFAIALLGALELFGRSHGLAAVAQQLHQSADEDHRDQDQGDYQFGHGFSAMNRSMVRASVSIGTPPPVTTASLNLRKSNFLPSACCALVRSRLISLWPTLYPQAWPGQAQ